MSKETPVDGFSPVRPKGSVQHIDHPASRSEPQAQGFVRVDEATHDVANVPLPMQQDEEMLPDFGQAAEEIDQQAYKKPRRRIKPFKLIKRFVVVALLAVVGFGGFLGVRAAMNVGNIFSGGGSSAVLNGEVAPEVLRKEGDGRVNALIIGIGGEGHDGANLADTIMIASLNPFDKQASLVSIPRDYYLEYNDRFMRINEVHALGEQLGEDQGAKELQAVIETQFDIPIHYFVRLDFRALEKAVDTLGGIDVTVANEVYDATVANDFGKPLAFEPGVHNMDGRTALFYSRSRKGSIGGGDLARTERQKEVMQAMFTKGLSQGIFSNPTRVQSLLSNFSENVKTSIELTDIMSAYSVAKDIDINTVATATVGYQDDEGNSLLRDYRTPQGAAVLQPADGNGENRRVSNFIKSKMIDSYITREAPRIVILNSSGIGGLAGEYEEFYAAMGYQVVEVGNYQEQGLLSQTAIVELNEKPYTRNFLLKRFASPELSSLAVTQTAEFVDYVIILGTDAEF